MGTKLKSGFQGTGSMSDFVASTNDLLNAVNNAQVIMPISYTGKPATISIENGRLTINFSDVDFSK